MSLAEKKKYKTENQRKVRKQQLYLIDKSAKVKNLEHYEICTISLTSHMVVIEVRANGFLMARTLNCLAQA